MSTDTCRIDLELTVATHEALVDDARKNKRSLRRQIEWVLDRYVESKKDDAA